MKQWCGGDVQQKELLLPELLYACWSQFAYSGENKLTVTFKSPQWQLMRGTQISVTHQCHCCHILWSVSACFSQLTLSKDASTPINKNTSQLGLQESSSLST